MIEVQTGIKVYGYVPVMKDCALESRYLGLKLPKERKDTEDKLTRLGEQILKSVDIAGLLELAENAPSCKKMHSHSTEFRLEQKIRYGSGLQVTMHSVFSIRIIWNSCRRWERN